MAKQNQFLTNLKAQAALKEARKTQMHVEIDTMAMLIAANERLGVGPGRASGLMNDFLAIKLEIAGDMEKELDEDKSKKKEIIVLRRDLAARLKEILGPDGWEKYHELFPFLREYW